MLGTLNARRHLLILGGTAEAAALAREALARFADRLAVTTSLAGRTEHPLALPGARRLGGFGGVAGLTAYLRAERVDFLIDATHPFAARISAQARMAAEAAGVARLLLWRPPWQRHPRDHWVEVDDLAGAASAVPELGRRAWLTIGASELGHFAPLRQVHFLVRLVDRPRHPLPLADYEVVIGRGPFALAEERSLIVRHRIELLVAKASGGAATEAKLIAARERDLPVVMVRRPLPEPGSRVDTVAAALDWLSASLSILPEELSR